MTKLFDLWRRVRSSLWFVPGVIVLAAVALAGALIEVSSRIEGDVLRRFPRLFGAGASGSRGMLTAIAGSMITVAGVVFSITLVALSLASSQYSSRVLRNFMSDRTNQTVLGVFVGIFAYCLVVLRTIREEESSAFVPSVAVLGGVALAFVGIAYLIYFIHHIAVSIQASQIIARIGAETVRGVESLFPEGVGEESGDAPLGATAGAFDEHRWRPVPAREMGYITSIHQDGLFELAERRGAIVRIDRGIGEFVSPGTTLASVLLPGPDTGGEEALARELGGMFAVSHQRTLEQDAAYGIRQLVDVALKALSPGINDTTNAVMCIDYLTAVLVRAAGRRIESPHRLDEKGELRLITRGATFGALVDESFDQIRQNAGGNVGVLGRMLWSLGKVADATASPHRRGVLARQARALDEVIHRTVPSPLDREPLAARSATLLERLGGGAE